MDQCKTNQNPVGLLVFCCQMAYLKFIWEDKRTKIISFGKENKVVGLTLSDFKSYCRTTEIRTVWYCDVVKRQTRDSWSRRVQKQIKLASWFLTKVQTQFSGERRVLSIVGARTIGRPYAKTGPQFSTYILYKSN